MKLIYALTAAAGFIGSALSAPAALLPTDEVIDISNPDHTGVKPDAIKDLIAPVTGIVRGLGLGGSTPGVSGSASSTVKLNSHGLPNELPELPESPETPEMPEFPELPESPEAPDIPEFPGMSDLPDVPGLFPEKVIQIISGASAVFQKLNIEDFQDFDAAKQLPVPDMDAAAVEQAASGLADLLEKLGLEKHAQQFLSAGPSFSDLPLNAIPTKFPELGDSLPVDLLAAIAPSLIQLLTALGLGDHAHGVVSLLGDLREGL